MGGGALCGVGPRYYVGLRGGWTRSVWLVGVVLALWVVAVLFFSLEVFVTIFLVCIFCTQRVVFLA